MKLKNMQTKFAYCFHVFFWSMQIEFSIFDGNSCTKKCVDKFCLFRGDSFVKDRKKILFFVVGKWNKKLCKLNLHIAPTYFSEICEFFHIFSQVC